jgi:hypothetical protein
MKVVSFSVLHTGRLYCPECIPDTLLLRQGIPIVFKYFLLLLLPGAELSLVESFGLLKDLFPFPSILDSDYPVWDLHLADVLFDVILPSVLGSSLLSFG